MFSPLAPAASDNGTLLHRKPRTRTVAQKKVYGKRRINAPCAVLDDGSPLKGTSNNAKPNITTSKPDTVDEEVAEVEEKLAAINIDESKPNSDEGEKQEVRTATPAKERRRISIKMANRSPKQEKTELRTPVKIQQDAETDAKTNVETRDNTLAEQTSSRRDLKKRSPRRKKPAPRLSSGCIQDEKTNAYVRQILDEAVSPIASQGVQKFSSWAARSESAFDAVKIAEGSYGEVYKLRLKEDVCKHEMSKSRLAKLRSYGEGVFKIVPLRAQTGPGSKKFTRVDEIVAEVKLLKLLDPIPGFARFREVHVVQGRFPESFQKAWMTYKQTKDDCMNPNPANKRAYPDNQLWAILEMDDAGFELEKFSWSSIFQVYDIFWGVAMALARAEEYALFEHRDLHMGNICLRSTRPDGRMDPPTTIDMKQFEKSSGFGISSLETTIIDYSLSRAEFRLSDDPEAKVEVASSDLDSKQLFDAIGRDEDEILLRDTYRYMRGQVYTGNPLDPEKPPSIPGIWAEYTPKTNLIWLLFLLKNLLKHMKTPETSSTHQQPSRQPLVPCPSKGNMQPASSHSPTKTPKKEAIECSHPETMMDPQAKRAIASFQQKLTDRLHKVLELLDLEHGREDMCCAADLVAYAIDQHWLDEKDFFLS